MLRLKALRKELNLSQKQFAEQINVAQNTVSNWENEHRDIDTRTLNLLADFFSVTVDYLLGNTDSRVKYNLKAIRLDNGYTPDDVARFLGIERGEYDALERNKVAVNPSTLTQLLAFYRITEEALQAYREEYPEAPPTAFSREEAIKILATALEFSEESEKMLTDYIQFLEFRDELAKENLQ